MNRERKFRFWCTSENRFITDPVIHGDGRVSAKTGICGRDYYYDVIIQEYTGFKDADGNEIYEGDILKNLTPTKYSDVNFTVEWGEFEPSDDMGVGGVGFVLPWFFTTFKPKVVGNIFENSELLKNESGA